VQQKLNIWTIYENTKDFPGKFVARRFELDQPTRDHFVGASAEAVRDWVQEEADFLRINKIQKKMCWLLDLELPLTFATLSLIAATLWDLELQSNIGARSHLSNQEDKHWITSSIAINTKTD
jgi:hypothetical protein